MSAIQLTQAQWADRIRASLATSVESIVAVGVDLVAAKSQLGHGRFTRMVEVDLGMNIRSAQRFMAIADHPVLANTTHGSHLPASYRTLYELSRVEEDLLEKAIADGLVTPEMERKDALDLAERYRTRTTTTVTTTATEAPRPPANVDVETGEIFEGDDREAQEVAAGASAPSTGAEEAGGTAAPEVPASSAPPPTDSMRTLWFNEADRITHRLLTIDPAALAESLTLGEAEHACSVLRGIAEWCDKAEASLSKPSLKAV